MEPKRERTNVRNTTDGDDDGDTNMHAQERRVDQDARWNRERSALSGSDQERVVRSLQPGWRSSHSGSGPGKDAMSDEPARPGDHEEKAGETPAESDRFGEGSKNDGPVPYGSQLPKRNDGLGESREVPDRTGDVGTPNPGSGTSQDPMHSTMKTLSDEEETGGAEQS
jgi:hypothetical protein